MAEKKGFLMFHSHEKHFDMLTDEQAGILIKALFRYSVAGENPEIPDKTVQMAFSFLADEIDRDTDRYEAICKRNAENGKKGGRPRKNASGKTEKSRKAKEKENENEKEKENEKVKVYENVKGSGCAAPDASTQPHTAPEAEPLFSEIRSVVANLGYGWTEQETKDFIAYNLDAGRHKKADPNWAWAAKKWEENRLKRSHSQPNPNACGDPRLAGMSQQEIDEMNAYLSLVNRFED